MYFYINTMHKYLYMWKWPLVILYATITTESRYSKTHSPARILFSRRLNRGYVDVVNFFFPFSFLFFGWSLIFGCFFLAPISFVLVDVAKAKRFRTTTRKTTTEKKELKSLFIITVFVLLYHGYEFTFCVYI